jgi:pyruvate/2-oxoglutarate dehydrogenase complex dihydrolipoamide dehydrogenase (E3) component
MESRVDTTAYDVIIIGSGQGGNPLATSLAAAGCTIALIEREHVGGTCINEGCTPTKTMVASARVAHLARRAGYYGVHTGPVSVSMRRVRERKRAIVSSFRGSGERRLENGDVHLIAGEASFTGPHSLRVKRPDRTELLLSAPIIVINTGARPVDPPLPGLDQVPHLNSTTIMELDEAPDHLIILGGGYVGLEFGQMFRRFGSDVTVVERGRRLMGREDDDIAEEVARFLREDGIEILLSSAADHVEQTEDGNIRLTVRCPDGERVLTGSHLLVAAGRAPNTEALNLDAAGIGRTARGFVEVDDRLRTAVPGVYALGDCAGSPAFTHISYDDFRIVKAQLIDGAAATRKDRLVPYTMFIDPPLGRVGLSEEDARAQGRHVLVAKIPMSYVARAIEVDETRGFVKAIVDADTEQILGCAVLGIEGGEVMAMIEIAMLGKLSYTALRDAVFAHPTLAEMLNTLFSSIESAAEDQPADMTSAA